MTETPTETPTETLIASLQNSNRIEDRKRAVADIIQHKTEAVMPLMQALSSDQFTVRMDVAEALGEIGDPRAIQALIETLNDEADPVRQRAASALGKIGDPVAVSALIEAFSLAIQKRNYFLREAIGKALACLGEPAVSALSKLIIQTEYTRVVAKILAQMGVIGLEELEKTLSSDNTEVRKQAIYGIGDGQDATCLPLILKTLSDDEERSVRYAAIGVLAKLKTPDAIKNLHNALNSDKVDVRGNAARYLGQIKDTSAIPKLAEMLEDKDDEVIGDVGAAFEQIGDQSTAPLMLESLESKRPRVRAAAARALGGIKDRSAVSKLIDVLLEDEDWQTRSYAARSLGEIQDTAALPALIKSLSDPQSRVQINALNALSKFGKVANEAVSLLIEQTIEMDNWAIRQDTIHALGKIGDSSVIPVLVDALNDDNIGVRDEAGISLDYMIAEGVKVKDLSGLVEALLLGKWEDTRWRAAWILGCVGDIDSVKPLIKALDDKSSNVRVVAIEALEMIGDTFAVPRLIKCLEDEEEALWGDGERGSRVCDKAARTLKILSHVDGLKAVDTWEHRKK